MGKQKQNNWAAAVIASVAWLIIWIFTQGLFMSESLMKIIPLETNVSILLATSYVAVILAISLVVFKKYNKKFLARTNLLYLYILPLILVGLLPFHYHLALPLSIYIFMIVVTVFWQDYLTFGIVQTYVQTTLTPTLSLFIVALLFTLGHFTFLISSFSSAYIPGLIALFCVSALFAWFRKHFGNIYIINVLHLSFLLMFA
jgi:hypothetical protein